MMKIAQIHAWGGNEVVKISDVEIPIIKENEVLIKVHAAGVNPIDWKVREGHYAAFMTEIFPIPMGWDVSGTVVSVGANVKQYKAQDEVYGLIRFFEPAGCFAEYVSAPVEHLSHKPAKMNQVEAAGIPLVALTAWQALFETTQLKKNQRVLIHAAAGAVGQIAVQLAKWQGAYVIATGSAATKPLLLSLGADQFIDYQSEKFEEKVNNIDLVLDLVGADVASRSLQVMKAGATLITFPYPLADEVAQRAKNLNIDAKFTIVKPNGEQLHTITHLIDDGLIQMNIEKVFPLDKIHDALALQQAGHCHGKIILKIS